MIDPIFQSCTQNSAGRIGFRIFRWLIVQHFDVFSKVFQEGGAEDVVPNHHPVVVA